MSHIRAALARRVSIRDSDARVIGNLDELLIAEASAYGTPLPGRTDRPIAHAFTTRRGRAGSARTVRSGGSTQTPVGADPVREEWLGSGPLAFIRLVAPTTPLSREPRMRAAARGADGA